MLNMTYEPLCVVSTRRALSLVMGDKAEILHSTGSAFRSANLSVPEPSVVRLSYYVRVPYQRRIALNRRSVFLRDGGKCQYCGSTAENIDHVIPKSRGGPHEWENVVAACRRCNSRKEDRMPDEAGLKLFRTPFKPKEKIWILARAIHLRSDWTPYLDGGSVLLAEGLAISGAKYRDVADGNSPSERGKTNHSAISASAVRLKTPNRRPGVGVAS